MSDWVVDVNRVRFVTKRFDELKGLRLAAVGAALTLVCGGFLAAGEVAAVPRDWEVQVVLLATFLPAAVCIYHVDRYYIRRFGPIHSLSQVSLWADPLHWLIVLGTPVGLRVANGAAVVIVVWSIHWLRIVWRDWPYRAHYLLGVGAAVIAVALTVGTGPSNSDESSLWSLILCAFGCIAVGLMDHVVLVRSIDVAASGVSARSEPVDRPDQKFVP